MLPSIIFGFIAGILIGSLSHAIITLMVACFTFSLFCFVCQRFVLLKYRRQLLLLGLMLFACGLGLGRICISNLNKESELKQYVSKQISARGIVVDEPDVREHNTRLTVRLDEIVIASTTQKVHEKIIVSVPIHPEYVYGDLVSVTIQLVEPKNIESEEGRIFDYVHYLRVRDIWYTSKFTRIHRISHGHGSSVKNVLFNIKHHFTNSINRVIPQPESSLLAGLLIGTKQSLGKDLLTEFSRAGVSHVVVLSGYNIAIVAESIMALLIFLPSTIAFGIGCVSILLFTILAGGGASAIRAAIMVLVALFAKKTNRTYTASRAFAIAVVGMLVWNPLLLAFDPSFQLSALATIGLIFVSPFFAPYLTRVTEKYGLREIVSSTIATQVIVLPFLIYNTGVLSLVSLPVNILILGTVPLTMLLGFITGSVGLISMYLAFIPALPTILLLWYQLTIVHIGATFPFGAVVLPAFSFGVLIFVYVLIFLGLYFLQKRKP